MILFYALVGCSVIGIIAVLWLLKKDVDSATQTSHDLDTGETAKTDEIVAPPPLSKAALSPLSVLLEKFPFILKLLKKEPKQNEKPQAILRGLPEEEENKLSIKSHPIFPMQEPSAGTASIIAGDPGRRDPEIPTLSMEEEKRVEAEIGLTSQLNELKKKYELLDRLFKEKSSALERAEESLQNELKNRKEFNKVKDILEKELKDTKDKSRNVQAEMNASQTEAESYQKRTNLLEEKVTKLEKIVITKEDEIIDLRKLLPISEAKPSVDLSKNPTGQNDIIGIIDPHAGKNADSHSQTSPEGLPAREDEQKQPEKKE